MKQSKEKTKTLIRVPGVKWSKQIWPMLLTGVSDRYEKGYGAFRGTWLQRENEIEVDVGSYILVYDNRRFQNKYDTPIVEIYQVFREGMVSVGISASGDDWALKIRDRVSKLFE